MATIVPTVEVLGIGRLRIKWAGMGTGDDGAWFSGAGRFKDKTVRVYGTAVTAVDIQGKNGDGSAPVTLNDSRGEGNPLTFAAADTRQILENDDDIRPKVTTGTAVTVEILAAA